MSLCLAIDTVTDIGSVAVGEPGQPRAEILIAPRQHAAQLMPSIMALLEMMGAAVADLETVVVADGPGSFTGLRIAFATVGGLLAARPGLSVHTAPSLLGAARVASRDGHETVATVYDALRGEVFGAVYRFSRGGAVSVVDPVLTTVEQLHRATAARGVRPEIAVCDTAALVEPLTAWIGQAPLTPPACGPRASALLELLTVSGAVARVEDPHRFEPEYGRKAEAQVKWERQHGIPLRDPGSNER